MEETPKKAGRPKKTKETRKKYDYWIEQTYIDRLDKLADSKDNSSRSSETRLAVIKMLDNPPSSMPEDSDEPKKKFEAFLEPSKITVLDDLAKSLNSNRSALTRLAVLIYLGELN